MSKESNQKSKNSENPLQDPQILLILGVVVAALLWRYEGAIKIWFYQNVLYFIAAGVLIVAAFFFRIWLKIKKREEAHFERARRLQRFQSNQSVNNHYANKRRS